MLTNAPSTVGPDEAVRRALEDLAVAGSRDCPDGVSASHMARALEVSPQHMARILRGERSLRAGQIARLPARAFAAVIATLHAARATTTSGSVEGSIAQVIAGAGEWLSLAGRILGDGRADPAEQVKATIALQALRAQIDGVLARLAQERGNVRAMKAGA